jgi:PTH2 family peptidyl-tRNA hydrolase
METTKCRPGFLNLADADMTATERGWSKRIFRAAYMLAGLFLAFSLYKIFDGVNDPARLENLLFWIAVGWFGLVVVVALVFAGYRFFYPPPALAPVKQIIVMRKDLGMRAGKMIAQGAHASSAIIVHHRNNNMVRRWLNGRFTKVCVRVESEEELLNVYKAAKGAGLLTELITDAGLTEFNGVPTKTCIAVGPATDAELRPVTGNLRLL